ncbi:MAG: PAS domain-containing protein, partial [Microcoleaceae cyanobacterium]
MSHNYLASFIGNHQDSSTDFSHTMERQYRSMFENAVSGIFQTTPDGHYLVANPALAYLYGYNSPDQLINGLHDIKNQLYVNPQRRDEFITALREHDVVAEFESQIYRQDGQIIWISENARAVRDEQGNLLYYEGFVEDITQRKQAEIGLKESEERLRLLIEGVKDYALFLLDVHGHVISWNAGAERIYGYSIEEIIGKHFSLFYINEDLQANLPAKEMQQAGELGRFEQEGNRLQKNGQVFWANTITTALYDEKKQLRGFA